MPFADSCVYPNPLCHLSLSEEPEHPEKTHNFPTTSFHMCGALCLIWIENVLTEIRTSQVKGEGFDRTQYITNQVHRHDNFHRFDVSK